ncbi:MAG TPA: SRPBCC family protein [Methylomirabilota bacterium]
MRGTLALVGGATVGAGLMYLLDPERGERRRAELSETLSCAVNDATERLGSVSLAEAAAGMRDTASGLRDAATMSVRQAATRLDAPRLMSELSAIAQQPASLRPAWLNGRLRLRRRAPATGFLEDHRWSLFGLAAGVLAAGIWGLWRREPGQVRESITVSAPPERVFDAWSRFEDFPRFMPAVRDVRPIGGDRWHWVVAGPAGAPVEFDTVVTRRDPPRVIGWTTVEGALVEHGGAARFRPTGDGTRVEVTMWWRPAGGGLGESVAWLSGSDPAHVLREGLGAFRQRLEREAVVR